MVRKESVFEIQDLLILVTESHDLRQSGGIWPLLTHYNGQKKARHC